MKSLTDHLLESLAWHRRMILIITVLGGILGYCCSTYLLPQQYESTTSIFIPDATAIVSGLVGADLMAEDAVEIAHSRTVLEQVMSSYGLTDAFTYEEFSDLIEAVASGGGRIVTITVTYTDPTSAQTLAQAVRTATADQIIAMTGTGEVYVIDEATLSSLPVGPNRVLWTIAAAIAGALLAVGVQIILFYRRGEHRIQDANDAAVYLDLPVLAVVPPAKSSSNRPAIESQPEDRRRRSADPDYPGEDASYEDRRNTGSARLKEDRHGLESADGEDYDRTSRRSASGQEPDNRKTDRRRRVRQSQENPNREERAASGRSKRANSRKDRDRREEVLPEETSRRTQENLPSEQRLLPGADAEEFTGYWDDYDMDEPGEE